MMRSSSSQQGILASQESSLNRSMTALEYSMAYPSSQGGKVKNILWRIWGIRDVIIFIATPLIGLPLALVGTDVGKCAYVLLIMSVFWLTQCIPLAVTGFLPLLLLPVTGLVPVAEVASEYVKDPIVLIISCFFVSATVSRWNLHKRIAIRILLLFGTEIRWLLLGIMVTTCILSMWLGNAIVTSMMMPIVQTILDRLRETVYAKDHESSDDVVDDGRMSNGPARTENRGKFEFSSHSAADADARRKQLDKEYIRVRKATSLGVAYASNIGGTATLIGGASNLIFQAITVTMYERFGKESPVTFVSWMSIAVPLSAICLVVTWVWLSLIFIRCRNCNTCCKKKKEDPIRDFLRHEYKELGPFRFQEIVILVHFAILVVFFLTKSLFTAPGWASLFKQSYVGLSTPAVLIASILFVFPSNLKELITGVNSKGEKVRKPKSIPLLTWEDANAIVPWSLLWILGGGFSLVVATKRSGLAAAIGTQLESISHVEPWVFMLIITTMVSFATEVTSNAATVTIILPIIEDLSFRMGVHPLSLMFPATLAARFSFMMPVATPTNAIVFSFGDISSLDMASVGVLVNMACVLILNGAMHTWGQALFDWNTIPDYMLTNVTASTTSAVVM